MEAVGEGVPRPNPPDGYTKLPDGTLDLTQIPPAQIQVMDADSRISHYATVQRLARETIWETV
jgi:hypothetical protein